MKYYMNDETENGIIVSDLRNNFILGNRNKTPRTFNNLEVAKVLGSIIFKNRELKYYIQLRYNGKLIRKSISDAQFREDHYEFFVNVKNENNEFENVKFDVYEKENRRCMHVGYIFFDNAETGRIDKEAGKVYQYQLMDMIKESAETIFKYSGNISGFDRIKKGITINVKNSTVKIHILHVSKLMGVNQVRKSKGFSCLPFIKDADKFRSFYVIIEKDAAESTKTGSCETALSIVNNIVEMLNDSDMPCYYKSMDDRNVYFCPIEKGDLTWEEKLSNPQNAN